MGATLPVYTPTPVVVGTDAADYPTLLGPRVGAATDANFTQTKTWVDSLEGQLSGVQYTPETYWVSTDNTFWTLGAGCTYHRVGRFVFIRLSVNRFGGTALSSSASGSITPTTMATLKPAVPPPLLDMYFCARVAQGPIINCTYARATGIISVRGCTALNYTFAASWTTDFTLVWMV